MMSHTKNSNPKLPDFSFLVFLVQKLWPKNNQLINYLIKVLMNYFVVFRPKLLNPEP